LIAGTTGATISGNRIYQTGSKSAAGTAPPFAFIRIEGVATDMTITGNRLGYGDGNDVPSGFSVFGPSGTPVGLRVDGIRVGLSTAVPGRVTISGNEIGNIEAYTTGGGVQSAMISVGNSLATISDNVIGFRSDLDTSAPIYFSGYSTGTPSLAGIVCSSVGGFTISDNLVNNLVVSTDSATPAISVFGISATGVGASGTIDGNTIRHLVGTASLSNTGAAPILAGVSCSPRTSRPPTSMARRRRCSAYDSWAVSLPSPET
jgi:hypothetical protein